MHRTIGEGSCLPMGPKVKFLTTFKFSELINSEHNERLEPKSVRVNNVAVLLSNLSKNKKQYVQYVRLASAHRLKARLVVLGQRQR